MKRTITSMSIDVAKVKSMEVDVMGDGRIPEPSSRLKSEVGILDAISGTELAAIQDTNQDHRH